MSNAEELWLDDVELNVSSCGKKLGLKYYITGTNNQIATTNFTINDYSLLKKTSVITNNNNYSTPILIFLE